MPKSYGRQFQSTLPYGSDRSLPSMLIRFSDFNPRSLTGATGRSLANISISRYFNPRSLTGATECFRPIIIGVGDFNPRSLTGATALVIRQSSELHHFNPRSLTGATLLLPVLLRHYEISIHAPLRERLSFQSLYCQVGPISIHAPLRERHQPVSHTVCATIFQSTLPYGSDNRFNEIMYYYMNFNPRSLTGATASKQITSLLI